MHAKTYKMRGLTLRDGRDTVVDLNVEFEGKRAFAIWDSINVGNLRLTARVEIDPKRLERITNHHCDYLYRGQLVLPVPQNN
jgi:hypothetical protein